MERQAARASNGPAGMPAHLDGTAFVSGTRLLYVGALVATRRHAHHAAQIVVAPEGVQLEDAANERVRARAAVIPPRVTHGHGACTRAALLFLDGDEVASRKLSRDAKPQCESWVRDAIDIVVPRDPTPEQARTLLASLVSLAEQQQAPRPRHPAVRRMCEYLDHCDHVDLASLSRKAGLSPRQMRHAFARDVELSMRAYLRWRRVRRAILAVERGASLSAAAAAAGFADSAHLTRAFREQFGITPSQGLHSIRWRTLD